MKAVHIQRYCNLYVCFMCMTLFRLFVKSDVLSVVTTVHTFQNKNENVYITQNKKTKKNTECEVTVNLQTTRTKHVTWNSFYKHDTFKA